MEREFASGSRQAPDPCDQFLEKNGYYRKHIARDSTSLFRVISDQIYQTQFYHSIIRKQCIHYMRKYKNVYKSKVEDIDNYLFKLSDLRTPGSMMELHAMAYLYQTNIILFEPFDIGTYFVQDSRFNDVIRVFITKDNKFDSIYTRMYMEDAAMCQSITYEIIYKDVFKLPDVLYAAENMLHGKTGEFVDSKIIVDDENFDVEMILKNGRRIRFDRPENTNCILDDGTQSVCNFHNQDFDRFRAVAKKKQNRVRFDRRFCDYSSDEDCYYDQQKTSKPKTKFVLLDRFSSCVRQILMEGVSPFPYKVAKSLDTYIYRNIEFDAWREMGRQKRLKRFQEAMKFLKIGQKCHVKLYGRNDDRIYIGHIQETSLDKGHCLVYIEELCEKHVVPCEALQVIPVWEKRNGIVGYNNRRLTENHLENCSDEEVFKKFENYEYCCSSSSSSCYYSNGFYNYGESSQKNFDYNSNGSGYLFNYYGDKLYMPYCNQSDENSKNGPNKLDYLTCYNHFWPSNYEVIAYPLTTETKELQDDKSVNNDNNTSTNKNDETASTKTANNQKHTSSSGNQSKTTIKHEKIDFDQKRNKFQKNVQANPDEKTGNAIGSDNTTAYQHQGNIVDQYCPIPLSCLFETAEMGYYQMCSPSFNAGRMYQPAPPPTAQQSQQLMHSSVPFYYSQPPPPITGNAYYRQQHPHYQQQLPNSPSTSCVNSSYNRGGTSTNNPYSVCRKADGSVNFSAEKSNLTSGADLPIDIPTLRFFYNLGIDQYRRTRNDSNTDAGRRKNYDKDMNQMKIKVEENASKPAAKEKSDQNNNNSTPLTSSVTTSTVTSTTTMASTSSNTVTYNSQGPSNGRKFNTRCFNYRKSEFNNGNNKEFQRNTTKSNQRPYNNQNFQYHYNSQSYSQSSTNLNNTDNSNNNSNDVNAPPSPTSIDTGNEPVKSYSEEVLNAAVSDFNQTNLKTSYNRMLYEGEIEQQISTSSGNVLVSPPIYHGSNPPGTNAVTSSTLQYGAPTNIPATGQQPPLLHTTYYAPIPQQIPLATPGATVPPFHTPYYVPGIAEASPISGYDIFTDPNAAVSTMPYTIMGYPPVPPPAATGTTVFYSPNGGNGNTGCSMPPPNANNGAQRNFWYPPIMQQHQPQQMSGSSCNPTNGAYLSSNTPAPPQ